MNPVVEIYKGIVPGEDTVLVKDCFGILFQDKLQTVWRKLEDEAKFNEFIRECKNSLWALGLTWEQDVGREIDHYEWLLKVWLCLWKNKKRIEAAYG